MPYPRFLTQSKLVPLLSSRSAAVAYPGPSCKITHPGLLGPLPVVVGPTSRSRIGLPRAPLRAPYQLSPAGAKRSTEDGSTHLGVERVARLRARMLVPLARRTPGFGTGGGKGPGAISVPLRRQCGPAYSVLGLPLQLSSLVSPHRPDPATGLYTAPAGRRLRPSTLPLRGPLWVLMPVAIQSCGPHTVQPRFGLGAAEVC